MDQQAKTRGPASYWTVTALGLLWNGFGAYLYIVSKIAPEAALADAPPAMREYVAAMPVWAHLGWSLGIWGSFIGSVLMLLRSRHAVIAFALSFLGAIFSFAGQAVAGVLAPGEPVMILAVIGFLGWYSLRSQQRGLLS